MRDWHVLRMEFLKGRETLEAFGARKDIPMNTLWKQASHADWMETRRELEALVESEVKRQLVEKASAHAATEAEQLATLVTNAWKAVGGWLQSKVRIVDGRQVVDYDAILDKRNWVQAMKESVTLERLIKGQPTERIVVEEAEPTEEEVAEAIALARKVSQRKR